MHIKFAHKIILKIIAIPVKLVSLGSINDNIISIIITEINIMNEFLLSIIYI